jgi:hypothetical protein
MGGLNRLKATYHKAFGGFAMSMLGSIYRISQSDIEAIHRDPGCVGDLLDWPEPPMDTKPGFFERIFFGKRSPSQVPSKRVPELATLPEADEFDIGTCWHILHFLFTGTAWEGEFPGSFLASGGLPVGRDHGYGPPRLFNPDEVKVILAFLETLTFQEFSAEYDVKKLTDADLYWQPGPTSEERISDLKYLWDLVSEMRQFIADGVNQGNGILVEIH